MDLDEWRPMSNLPQLDMRVRVVATSPTNGNRKMLSVAEKVQKISWRLKYLPHFIPPEESRDDHWYARVKVAFDYSVAVLLLPFVLPVIALAALVVKLTSKGPAFYVQVRLGRDGRPYRLYKIRTMMNDCERLTGARWSTPGDPRITRVGRFLRNTHLDELPQLFNVLRGDMSLVGPRPERPELIPGLEEAIPGYRQRLLIKPGVTGLAQVQLPADTSTATVRRKLSYDLYYVRRFSFWLDLRLLACTALKVIGISAQAQRRLMRLPDPDKVQSVSRLPLEQPQFHSLGSFQPA
jgi:lipopolysaccharide/colanic/teichoic acid biosynthesis glycosyltransferase